MEDSDNDTTDKDTDGTDKSFSDSLEAFQMNNEDLSANVRGRRRADEQSNDADSAEEQSGEGLPATDEELEREMKELEAKVRRLQDEEQLLKQMLSSALTRSQLENRMSFYKFSGLYVSKFTDSKLCVDLTPTLHGKRSGCFSYYVQFRILSDDCFEVEKTQLPSSIKERLQKAQVSRDELRRLLDHLRHVCECTEVKMKQFTEAEKDPRSADEGENINVSHTIFASDNFHVEVGFRPTHQKYSHLWLVILLLYNDNEIFFEPQGIQVQSKGFSKEIEQRMKQLFLDGCNQELKFVVWKAKNFISGMLECMNQQESSSEYVDSN